MEPKYKQIAGCAGWTCPAIYEQIAGCMLGQCPSIYTQIEGCYIAACPSVHKSEEGDYLIVGKKVSEEHLKESGLLERIGEGETAIEVPRSLIKKLISKI